MSLFIVLMGTNGNMIAKVPQCIQPFSHQWHKGFLKIIYCFIFAGEQDQDTEQIPQTLSPDLGFNKSQSSDCPRDSGCYASSENSDSKDDPDTENLSALVHAVTITESN